VTRFSERLFSSRGWLIGILPGIFWLLNTIYFGLTPKSTASFPASAPIERQLYMPLISRPYSSTCPDPAMIGASDGRPSWGSSITISPLDGAVWVVNPDAGSVSMIETQTLVKVVEIPTGSQPWSLAFSPDGHRLYVLDRSGGRVFVVNAQTRALCASIPVGPWPAHIALSPEGRKLYVTVTNQGELAVIDTASLTVSGRLPVPAQPFAVAVTDDGDGEDDDEKIYITHKLAFPKPGAIQGEDDSGLGRLTVINAGNLEAEGQIDLAADGHGYPNQLASVSIFENRGWVPHIRAAPALPNGLTTKVFAAVSELDLAQDQEELQALISLNDQQTFGSPVNNPVEAVPSPDGSTLFVVLAGSNLVEVIDVSTVGQPRLVRFLPTGSNPRGMSVSQDGRRGYVMNYLSRSVTVLDLEQLALIAEIPVTGETLDPQVLKGKILFNNATDPRLSQGSWTSCASCHPDGGTDGVTWILPDGPRQTPPLWNAGQTLPWHWSATLDETQDVEETIEGLQHGLGLAPGIDPLLLGQPNAGRSADLDALAAFLEQGVHPPTGPHVEGDVALGRAVFQAAGCASCHGGLTWTSSALPGPAGTLDGDGNGSIDPVLRDVGTLNQLDVRGQGGFDPPSLLGVAQTPPYLHDGSMPTLEALLDSGHPDPNGNGNNLTDQELAALVSFLQAIGPNSEPLFPALSKRLPGPATP
jgi:YVTN family beta-propeller protein